MRLKLVYVFTALVYLASTSFAHADSSFKWSSTQRNATQRNVNGLVLVDGSPGANGGPGENGGTAGLEAQGKTAVAEGMVGMEMVPVTVEMAVAMEEMVEMAGTDETRYVAQM